ncbi:MAG: serine/threonine protein kinase [Deltaproteobacteria bacterium]|nr:serine/threonine protein kinase [Deltaproteobacteria bacterium]
MPEPSTQDKPQGAGKTGGSPVGAGPMGQYYLLEKIAQGGMAEIYKGLAYDLHGIKRTVVIKKILPQVAANKEFIDMLIAEAKLAVMLSHGNIAQIYDLGKAGDAYFIVMEYVEGRSLGQLMKQAMAQKQPIPLPIAMYIVAEIAAGLDYMHRRTDDRDQPLQIIHRDVSPQNIIVSVSGTVKIIDFGIAKARNTIETTDIGILKGKFAYMSPEQAEGNPIDHRSDIFSLGVILHELITGQRLFKAKDHRETLRNVRRAAIHPPSSVRADCPPELDTIIAKALAKDRDFRYAYASEMRAELLRLLHQSHPDFHPEAIVAYGATLFEQPAAPPVADDDAKTPLLIIDHTQSAIAHAVSGAPPPASEYFFAFPEEEESVGGEAPPLEGETLPTTGGEASSAAAPSITSPEESSYTPIAPAPLPVAKARFRRGIRIGAIGLAGVLLAAGGWRWWQAARPSTAAPVPVAAPASPAPPATLTIASDPPGATIYLNDRATTDRTPATLDRLTVGTDYTIGLYLDGYRFWTTEWTAAAGASDRLDVPLVPDYGGLEVLSIPPGAAVTVDGVPIGATPLTRDKLPPGTPVTIAVEADGYAPWRETVQIAPGTSTTVRAVLRRASAPNRPAEETEHE